MYKILFVCTGNICRSPTAEGVIRQRLHDAGLGGRVQVDSAGTHSYHIGEAPDPRSIAAAKRRGIDIGGLRSRQVKASDYQDFNLILGLDASHVQHLRQRMPAGSPAEIHLFLDYCGVSGENDVPDPYYGDTGHFEHVLDLIESASPPLITKLQPYL